MSNIQIKNGKVILNGITEKGENVTIDIKIEDIIHVRDEFIRNNKTYVTKIIFDAIRLLVS